jgi:hypothetical protein
MTASIGAGEESLSVPHLHATTCWALKAGLLPIPALKGACILISSKVAVVVDAKP